MHNPFIHNGRPVPLLTTDEGMPMEIPAAGSLGLLALGAEGLYLWRAKRAQMKGAEWQSTIGDAARGSLKRK